MGERHRTRASLGSAWRLGVRRNRGERAKHWAVVPVNYNDHDLQRKSAYRFINEILANAEMIGKEDERRGVLMESIIRFYEALTKAGYLETVIINHEAQAVHALAVSWSENYAKNKGAAE